MTNTIEKFIIDKKNFAMKNQKIKISSAILIVLLIITGVAIDILLSNTKPDTIHQTVDIYLPPLKTAGRMPLMDALECTAFF